TRFGTTAGPPLTESRRARGGAPSARPSRSTRSRTVGTARARKWRGHRSRRHNANALLRNRGSPGRISVPWMGEKLPSSSLRERRSSSLRILGKRRAAFLAAQSRLATPCRSYLEFVHVFEIVLKYFLQAREMYFDELVLISG